MKITILHPCLILLIAASVGCSSKNTSPLFEEDTPATSLNTKIRVTIDQKFKDASRVDLSILEEIKRLLTETGFDVVDKVGDSYNLALKTKVRGQARAADYYGYNSKIYTGADLYGAIFLLDSSGKEIDSSHFSGEIQTPYSTQSTATDPNDAPFYRAFISSDYYIQLAELIKRKYGNDPLFFYWRHILKASHKSPSFNTDTAISALKALHDIRSIKPLLKYANPPDDIIQVGESLALYGAQAVDLLISILESDLSIKEEKKAEDYKNEYAKAYAAYSLGKIGDKKAVDALTDAVDSKSVIIRIWSALALIKMGDSQKIDVIINSFDKNSNGIIQMNALWALSETGDKRAIEPILRIYKYGFPGGEKVTGALKKITGKDMGTDAETLAKWWEQNKNQY